MIDSLKVNNYRSIRKTTIDFSSTGLDVFIGANGTGKSNVAKSLDFISSISRNGLNKAVMSQGGKYSIIPKAYPFDKREDVTKIVYSIPQTKPELYPEEYDRPSGTHAIEISWDERGRYRVEREYIEYTNPLAVGWALHRKDEEGEEGEEAREKPPQSEIRYIRKGDNIERRITPEPKEEWGIYMIRWMVNVPSFINEILSEIVDRDGSESVQDVLGMSEESEDVSLGYKESMLEADNDTFLSFQKKDFRSKASRIKRFDLQLMELRRAQLASEGDELSVHGSNMPDTVSRFSSDNTTSWDRILETLKEIAPHIQNLDTEHLKTGREYVRFFEQEANGPVASWASSDGTLRALAILLAIESHEEGGTIIIEEPELGLHPWAIKTMMKFMRKVISDNNIQVVLTTHSRSVLEEVNPEEVWVTSRKPDKGTIIESLKDNENYDSIKKGQVGRLWKKGMIGGVPEYRA